MLNRRDFLKSMIALLGSAGVMRTLGTAFGAPGSGQRFFIPPTVLHVTDTTALIYYRLAELTESGVLVVSKGSEEVHRIALPVDVLRQQITITDLEPSTTYDYRIEVAGVEPPYLDGQSAWSSLSFRTQPYEFPVRFAAIGDSGFGEETTLRLAEHIVGQNVDFLIHLGDIVYWSYQYGNDLWMNWAAKYYLPFDGVLRRVPHYPTVGNHDREAATLLDGWSFYYWAFPPIDPAEAYDNRRQWYSFVINDIQFISLNTQTFYSEPGRQEQEEWLEAKLAAAANYRTTIIFFHIPFWTSGLVHAYDGIRAGEKWHPKFAAVADHIGLVMSGHSHLYERIMRDKVRYLTSGGGSAAIYPHDVLVTGSEIAISQPHYTVVEIHEDHLVQSAYGLNNEELDRAEWLL